MIPKSVSLAFKILAGLFLCVLVILVIRFHVLIGENISLYYRLFSDREKIRDFIVSFGVAAPLVFMGIQVLQVIFAPIPGEATGFIGGYLFGTLNGFFFSSIALTVGSVINFAIGRFLGERFVRKMIPAEKFNKMDSLLKRQGVIVVFFLFVFPGFPKDYLCLFLGLSTLAPKVFILLAAVGRLPGTFMLSLQGAFLYEQNYFVLGIVAGLCTILALIAYRYRDTIYRWLERFNNQG